MRLLHDKSSHRKLRRSGKWFLIILIADLLGAWNTGTNLFYIILGGLLSFMLISIFLPGRSLKKLAVKRDSPAAVHRGEAFVVGVRIENQKRFMPALSIRLESANDKNKSLGYIMRIPAKMASLMNVQVVFDRRGVYRLPDFDLVCSYPFGLYEKRRRFADNWEVVVYPRVLPARTNVLDQASGTRYMSQKPTADGDEFYGLREYVPGDDLRLIAWRASARFGTWIIRELARENSRFVTFALDTRRIADVENFDDAFEEVVEMVASLSVTLLKRQYNIGIVTPDTEVEPGEGSGQERLVLEMLARVNPIPPDKHPDFEARVRALEGERSLVLYFSADSRTWGIRAPGMLSAVDPREVLHA